VKGISHFLTGVALATFFPQVVQAGAQGSLLPVLGGISALLPDTIDFKFVRYFENHDLEIDPGPKPDADEIARQMRQVMRHAYEIGEPQSVMLHTIRLGSDRWRQYAVRFDPEHEEVAVRIGPIVNTGQIPLPGSEPSLRLGREERGTEARTKVGVPMAPTYAEENIIDIFSGPSFTFERQGDELHVRFLDWHRRWSHSLTTAAVLGWAAAGGVALAEVLSRGVVTRTPLWAGLVAGLGLASHIVEDQLGFMGSNLVYPFTKRRTAGLGLLRSGDAIPNFLTVWVSIALILFNLDRFSAQPRLTPLLPHSHTPWWFLALAVALPIAVLGGLYQRRRREGPEAADRKQPREALQQWDIVSEMEEVTVE